MWKTLCAVFLFLIFLANHCGRCRCTVRNPFGGCIQRDHLGVERKRVCKLTHGRVDRRWQKFCLFPLGFSTRSSVCALFALTPGYRMPNSSAPALPIFGNCPNESPRTLPAVSSMATSRTS
jgi:hypothetical protein